MHRPLGTREPGSWPEKCGTRGRGVAVREYPTEVVPMAHALFVDGGLGGGVEAKREADGQRLTAVEHNWDPV